jgi:hypothetical protein
MAHRETRLVARNAARWIEYPADHLDLGDRDWSWPLLARPLLLGLGGLALALVIDRARQRRRHRASVARQPRPLAA